jgi:hypothetical protein
MPIAPYKKFIVALASVLAVAAIAASDGKLTGEEDAAIVATAVAALGVFQVKNKYVLAAEDVAVAVTAAVAPKVPDVAVPAPVAEAVQVAADVTDAVK